MRIAVNTLSVLPGKTAGGETYLVNLLRSMVRASPRDTFVLVVSPRNRSAFEGFGPNVELSQVRSVFGSRPARVLYERTRLARRVRRLGADVVYMPGNAGLPAPPCPEVVAVQSLHYLFVPEEVGRARTLYFSTMLPRDLRKADLVLAVSEEIGRTVTERLGIPDEKVRVVLEGVNVEFKPEGDVAETERLLADAGVRSPFVLFVSALKPYKNADKAIRALAVLNRSLETPRQLLVIGPDRIGMTGDLQDLARREGVADLVRFSGFVPHEDLGAFYRAADVFLMPSAIETFGLPVLEAMACGTPVVGSNLTSIPEVMGGAGLNVDPEDIGAFADSIRRLIVDESLRQECIRKGFERVEYLNWDRAARGTLEVLREALERGRR